MLWPMIVYQTELTPLTVYGPWGIRVDHGMVHLPNPLYLSFWVSVERDSFWIIHRLSKRFHFCNHNDQNLQSCMHI